MQGATELAVLAIAFLGLQAWWLSKLFLRRPRQPRPLGFKEPMKADSMRDARNSLEKIFGDS